MLLPVNSHANYRRSTSVIPSRYILVRPREEPTSAFSLGAIISISLYLGLAQREPFRRWSRAWLSGDATDLEGGSVPATRCALQKHMHDRRHISLFFPWCLIDVGRSTSRLSSRLPIS